MKQEREKKNVKANTKIKALRLMEKVVTAQYYSSDVGIQRRHQLAARWRAELSDHQWHCLAANQHR